MQLKAIVSVWCVVVFLGCWVSALDDPEDTSSCTRIDFDEATLSSLQKCDYMQEFIVKRYNESEHFNPFRPEAVYYLSHRWQGLTCGETVDTYSFNEETELRMAYNLVFDSGATLEVRVFDEDRIDADNKPTLVEIWHTVTSTEGWGLFREKLNKTVKKARIQIEANINAGSDLAIEYLTIFNYEVETDECTIIDEFSTTVPAPSSSTEPATTVTTTETTTQQPVTTTSTLETTVTTTATISSTLLSTVDPETTVTTAITSEQTTIMTDTTTVTSSTTELLTTTTTNAGRDDTSIQPSSSTLQQTIFTDSISQTTDSPKSTTIFTTTDNASSIVDTISTKQWLWMTLTAVFAILFILATSVAIYLCLINRHLERISARLLGEVDRYPCKKM